MSCLSPNFALIVALAICSPSNFTSRGNQLRLGVGAGVLGVGVVEGNSVFVAAGSVLACVKSRVVSRRWTLDPVISQTPFFNPPRPISVRSPSICNARSGPLPLAVKLALSSARPSQRKAPNSPSVPSALLAFSESNRRNASPCK